MNFHGSIARTKQEEEEAEKKRAHVLLTKMMGKMNNEEEEKNPSATTVEVTSVAPGEHLRGHPSASIVDTSKFGTRTFFLGRAPTRASDVFID